MLTKLFIILIFIAMLVSLAMALWFMFADRGRGKRTAQALTVRIGIWVILFALLVIGMFTGVIKTSHSPFPSVHQRNNH